MKQFIKTHLAKTTSSLVLGMLVLAVTSLGTTSHAGSHSDDVEMKLTIENNQFIPSEVHVPAGKRVKLVVLNKGDMLEEFESPALKREKAIPAGTRVTIFLDPLEAGAYAFFGEFHPDSAQGIVIAE